MGGDELVAHRPDLIEGQDGRGVGIEHDGVVDVLALAGEGGFDGQVLDIDVGLAKRGELRRKSADMGRLHALGIDQARDFHARS